MKTPLFLAGVILSLVSPSPLLSYADDNSYTDVADNFVYADAISSMTEAGVVSGYDDQSFKPDNEVSRVEALKMIMEATENDETTAGTDAAPFEDMDLDAWYLPYVNYAFQEGFINGDGDGNSNTLRPNNSVNRAEALKMLISAASLKDQLPEVTSENWFDPYIQYAADSAILVPNEEGSYLAEAILTRGELCELLYRFQTHPYTGQVEFGDATYYGYGSNGSNTASGTTLDAYGFMAAHKTLPFGTQVRVTNIKNNRSVIVTIVDRGPYGAGRIVDLTPAAFEELGSLSTGVLDVRLEVLADNTTL